MVDQRGHGRIQKANMYTHAVHMVSQSKHTRTHQYHIPWVTCPVEKLAQ